MEKCAIWKDHKVVGYIELTEEQKKTLNRVPVYILDLTEQHARRSMQKVINKRK